MLAFLLAMREQRAHHSLARHLNLPAACLWIIFILSADVDFVVITMNLPFVLGGNPVTGARLANSLSIGDRIGTGFGIAVSLSVVQPVDESDRVQIVDVGDRKVSAAQSRNPIPGVKGNSFQGFRPSLSL